MPNPLNVPITPPRVAFIDPHSGAVSREWYMFLLSLHQLTGGSTLSLGDLQKTPPQVSIDEVTALVSQITANLTQPSDGLLEQVAELSNRVGGLEVHPRTELGTMSQLQQDNLPWVGFDTATENVPTSKGVVKWDDSDNIQTMSVVMDGISQPVGESQYYRIKADTATTKGQVVMFTGAVGAAGALKGAPATLLMASTALYTIGIAAEDIDANEWGYVTSFGLVSGVNTTGGGEAWADGQVLYLDPSVAGGLTKTLPTAPNPKVIVAAVVHASSSGILFVRPTFGGKLGDFEGDVNITSVADGDLLQYDLAQQRWENTIPSSLSVGKATNIAGGAAGSVPYQSALNTTAFRAIGTAGQVFRVNSGATAPEWVSAAVLTASGDTNVTMTLGGTPSAAVLAATSITLGWTGQLSVARGGTGQSAFGANRIPFIDSGGGFSDSSSLTYNGTTFGVTGKASYLNPTLGTGGFNILASYSYDNGSANTIGGSGTFNQSCFTIHISTGTGLTSIPVYTNGGAGVAWTYIYLDPDAATWTVSAASPIITFTAAGTGGNTFQVQLDSNNGSGTIQRTAGTNAYTVYIQMIALN